MSKLKDLEKRVMKLEELINKIIANEFPYLKKEDKNNGE